MKIDDQQIKHRIHRKTEELITQFGIKGWNMDRLAQESGLAKNTLYKIIGSKEKLLNDVITSYQDDVQTALTGVMQSQNDYVNLLEEVILLFPKLLNGVYADHMHEIFLEYPSIEENVRHYHSQATAYILSFIQKGIDQGFLANTLNADQVFAMLQIMVLHVMKQPIGGKEKTERIRVFLRYLLYGLLQRND